MSHKKEILNALNKKQLPEVHLPDLDDEWIVYEDVRQQFSNAVEQVGGQCHWVKDSSEVVHQLQQIPAYRDGRKVCSLLAEYEGNVDMNEIEDPHQLEDVDFAIGRGEFGVAENGAIWTTDVGVRHRVILFLAQHVALVIPAGELVDNMHQAYDRIKLGEPHFGAFISGPSKTADIEQSLVIGAHGARSLSVFIVGE